MASKVRTRFWVESILAIVTAAMFIVTLVSRDWIEEVFGVEPDAGNGSLEWLLVAVLLAISVLAFLAARVEWRRGVRATV